MLKYGPGVLFERRVRICYNIYKVDTICAFAEGNLFAERTYKNVHKACSILG